MREISWSLVLGFILAAMALPALASRLYFDDESYMTVPPVVIGNSSPEMVNQLKNLGIFMTDTLNWNIQHVRSQVAPSWLVQFFEYASLTYCDLTREQMDTLQKGLKGERGGRDETDNQMYEEVNKRALVALSRFKTFASALSPDIHRYAPRSYFPGIDSNLALGAIDRRGRPAQNPMRFGR